jgi:DNA-directed RNA polymerase subunit M/transcription elongation factor TFIIS
MPPAPKKSVQVLLLTQKAEVKEVALNTAADGSISLAMIQALMKKKVAPEMLGSYKNRAQTLFMFGYTTGKAGTENKHELPPPHDNTHAFGDIVLLASKDDKSWEAPVAFKSSDYEAFYTRAFGGFEELESEEELEETEEIEEEEVEEVEDEVEEEPEAEVDAEAEAEETVVVTRTKKKTRRALAATVSAGAAQVYTTYLYVPAENELVPEPVENPYDLETLPSPRKSIRKSIGELLKDYLSPTEMNMFERCIYNGAVHSSIQRHVGKSWTHQPFIELYSRYAKHITANFHPKSYVGNTELYERYRAGEITFDDISKMDTYQLFEGRWSESFEQQQVREKRQLEGNKAMATDRFSCGRCHKRECTYYELQTRAADEPMTIFITCLNCGKHWRQ